ncbi:MAG: NAD(P)H-binding protein [Catenulispora sp.]|nr:NAD(P)H-binding protein [Catenulispora sp.]
MTWTEERRHKITLLDATGSTGQRILDRALAAGHQVIALVRDPE